MRNAAHFILLAIIIYFVYDIDTYIKTTRQVIIAEPADSTYLDHAPPSIQVREYLKIYAEKYNVPYKYAKRMAYLETSYRGVDQFGYNPAKTSSAGAEGVMQVMYSTAKGVLPHERFTREDLRKNVELNIKASMKYLRRLYEIDHNWERALQHYNGASSINSYVRYVVAKK